MVEKLPVKLPLYAKMAQIVLGLLAFFYILYIGKGIIAPILFATIIAILLNPVVDFLHRKGFNRVLAIILVILITIILVLVITGVIGAQARMFGDSYPQLKEKFSVLFGQSENWVVQHFNVDKNAIDSWIAKTKTETLNSLPGVAGQTIGVISGGLIVLVLLPVYVFMILFYKVLLLGFIARLFQNNEQDLVNEVLDQTKILIQNYLVGLLIEAAIVATLNSVGLLILGVQYAILLGVIGAILNVIPYIGGIIAIALPMLIAFATQSPLTALLVLIVYMVIQFIDNHYIVPNIVASKVKINGLISIIVVLFGGAFWGVAGMFLAIPITGILKVIFDRADGLEPFGYLLGEKPDEGRKGSGLRKLRRGKN